MEQDLKIGVVTLKYDTNGTVVSAWFRPSMELEADISLIHQLRQIKDRDTEKIVQDASLVLGAWFLKVQEVEEADRDQFHLEGKVLNCTFYEDGTVKECFIEYTYKKVKV